MIGTSSIVDLRLLGLASTNRVYSELAEQVLPWTWGAFVLAAISGTLMFISQPWTYLNNAAFRTKFALMFLAGVNMLVFQLITIGEASNWDRNAVPRSRERSPPRFRSCSGTEFALRRLKKISGASRRGSVTFCNDLRRLFIQCKDLKTLTISTPSLRLGGKASGQTLTEIGRI